MQLLRDPKGKRVSVLVQDPSPVADVGDIWTSAAQMATIGIFVLLLIACLYFSRGLLLPAGALLVGATGLVGLRGAFAIGAVRS